MVQIGTEKVQCKKLYFGRSDSHTSHKIHCATYDYSVPRLRLLASVSGIVVSIEVIARVHSLSLLPCLFPQLGLIVLPVVIPDTSDILKHSEREDHDHAQVELEP